MTTRKEMLEYINTDPETGRAFQALVHIEKKEFRYHGSVKKARTALLNAMILRGCFNNMERVRNFIMYNYSQREVLGAADKLFHGYNGVRI